MTTSAPKLATHSQEQEFLEWFSTEFRGRGLESQFHFGSVSSFCTSFSEKFAGREIAGHGYDVDPSMAALKGAAELMERRAVIEYFRRNPGEPLPSSNGWAVHLSPAAAVEAARREAIERHILLYTYLRSGWSEFVLLDRRVSRQGVALFLASPYSQNGYFAGMVVYQDNRFPGISLGYLADGIAKVRSSARWNHALFESVGFVERGIETSGFSHDSENSIYNGCKDWLLTPWMAPKWKMDLRLTPLPEVSMGISSGKVSTLTPSYENLHFARVEQGNLIPLFMVEDLGDSEKNVFIEKCLVRYGLSPGNGRTPVL